MDEFFSNLLQIDNKELILLGDFNAVFNNAVDRSQDSSTSGFPSNFHSYIETFQLIDAWRIKHLTELDYTYFSACHLSHSRVILIMVFENLNKKIKSVLIGPQLVSDHAPAVLDWQIGKKRPRISRWHLNKLITNCAKYSRQGSPKNYQLYSME